MIKLNAPRKPLDLSRGPSIDTEQCIAQVGGNRFNLVLIAATRAREIKRGHSTSEQREHVHSNITALQEIQEGKIGIEYLKKMKFNEPRNMIDRGAKFK
jgi:DNA-directed RNA polymerase omega subunit